MRIDVAYCVELGRIVDIQEACNEFFSQKAVGKFSFLCSDPRCRNSRAGGVRVIGVNHYRMPEEGKVFKSPHYRELDEHIPTCEWKELEAALAAEDLSSDDAERGASPPKRRKPQSKVTRLITRFVIPEILADEAPSNEIQQELGRIRNIGNREVRRRELVRYARGTGSTATSLEALVTCYEELKSENALGETFDVSGYGPISFRDAFRHIGLASTGGFVVLYGGARLYKRYGTGFALHFMDRIPENTAGQANEVLASFYVSSEDLKKYRPSARLRRMVDEVENNKERRPYLKVYWIGALEKTEKGYRAVFTTLAHVVMRLIYPSDKPSVPMPAPESLV